MSLPDKDSQQIKRDNRKILREAVGKKELSDSELAIKKMLDMALRVYKHKGKQGIVVLTLPRDKVIVNYDAKTIKLWSEGPQGELAAVGSGLQQGKVMGHFTAGSILDGARDIVMQERERLIETSKKKGYGKAD